MLTKLLLPVTLMVVVLVLPEVAFCPTFRVLLPPVTVKLDELCPNPCCAMLTPFEDPVMFTVAELPVASPCTCPILTSLLPPLMVTEAEALSLVDPEPNVVESNPNRLPEVEGTVMSLVKEDPLPCNTVTELLLPPVMVTVWLFRVPLALWFTVLLLLLAPDVSAELVRRLVEYERIKLAAAELDDLVGDRQVILRVDRIEPAKNIVRGFTAYDRLLAARPGLRGRVVFVDMCSPSRQGIPGYRAYADEVVRAAEAVNDRWATSDWLPVVLDVRDDFSRSLAGLERYDVLFVNPVRDGLNLVAKEGPALNRRDGVLCLSPGAGAFDELAPAAIGVHPFDIEQAASALDTALALPFDERAVRAEHLRRLAVARTPADWLRDLVGHAGEHRQEP